MLRHRRKPATSTIVRVLEDRGSSGRGPVIGTGGRVVAPRKAPTGPEPAGTGREEA